MWSVHAIDPLENDCRGTAGLGKKPNAQLSWMLCEESRVIIREQGSELLERTNYKGPHL